MRLFEFRHANVLTLLWCFSTVAHAEGIPEIESLRSGSIIPEAIYESYSTQQIGEALVKRLERSLLDPKGNEDFHTLGPPKKTEFDPMTQSEIHLYFEKDTIEGLIANKEFLNLHQKPGIQGYETRIEFRDAIETGLARLRFSRKPTRDVSSPINRLRPKSAILEILLPAGQRPVHRGGTRYGAIVAVLKNEVKARTTYTPYDSGTVFSSPATTTDRLRKEVRPLLSTNYFFNPAYPSEYFEAHVWGALTLADVDHFMVPAGMDVALLKKLKTTGISIYEYKEEKSGKEKNGYYGDYHRVRGKLVAADARGGICNNPMSKMKEPEPPQTQK